MHCPQQNSTTVQFLGLRCGAIFSAGIGRIRRYASGRNLPITHRLYIRRIIARASNVHYIADAKDIGVEPTVMASPETRDRIINTAARLFAEFGYHGVSLRTIAKEAGVQASLAQYHFKTKELVFRAVFERCILPINHDRHLKLDAATKKTNKPKKNEATLTWCYLFGGGAGGAAGARAGRARRRAGGAGEPDGPGE